jgi:GT2 family glycosyltransferase
MFSCEAKIILNRLVVRIGVPRSATVSAVTVLRSDGTPHLAFPHTDDPEGAPAPLHSAGRSFSKQSAIYTFVSEAAELSHLAPLWKATFTTECVIDGEPHQFAGPATFAELADIPLLGPQLLKRLASLDDVGPLVQSLGANKIGRIENAPFHIDFAFNENGCLFLNGWMANFGYLDAYVLVNGCASVVRAQDAIIYNRPDVNDYIRNQGVSEIRGDGHGFSLAIDCLDASQPLTIGILLDGVFYIAAQPTPPISQDKGRVFQLLLGARQGTSFTPPEKITRMLAPFLRANNRSLDYDVVSASHWSDGLPPRLSIVVPFYKEWRFLYSLLSMIRDAPPDFEWVIVCDDASIFPQMNLQIANQLESVRQRITFVLPRQNVGYGHANNIGVKEAKASRVLLMNSDIWLKSFDVLEFGLQVLDDGPFALLGFTLLFEDQTTQHDGLTFRRSIEVGGHYLALHPGKGLPARPTAARFALDEVQAVTGALMLMQRDLFQEIGGFADCYIGGDFEDADLCLTLRERGQKIGLVRSTEAFHLERQSIRLDAANSVGFARTLVNCESFNRRWADILDANAFSPGLNKDKRLTVVN